MYVWLFLCYVFSNGSFEEQFLHRVYTIIKHKYLQTYVMQHSTFSMLAVFQFKQYRLADSLAIFVLWYNDFLYFFISKIIMKMHISQFISMYVWVRIIRMTSRFLIMLISLLAMYISLHNYTLWSTLYIHFLLLFE